MSEQQEVAIIVTIVSPNTIALLIPDDLILDDMPIGDMPIDAVAEVFIDSLNRRGRINRLCLLDVDGNRDLYQDTMSDVCDGAAVVFEAPCAVAGIAIIEVQPKGRSSMRKHIRLARYIEHANPGAPS